MENELIEIILHRREERNIEYKSSLSWNDSDKKAKITKSILAMANIRDGGFIVIGVKQENNHFILTGMPDNDFNSYDQDNISSYVANYADPFVEFNINKINHEGKKYVIIQVKEFYELPIICKKDGSEGLKNGAIYTRTRRKYETAEVPSQTEMREIIESATNKGIKKFRERLSIFTEFIPKSEEELSEEKFKNQLNGL